MTLKHYHKQFITFIRNPSTKKAFKKRVHGINRFLRGMNQSMGETLEIPHNQNMQENLERGVMHTLPRVVIRKRRLGRYRVGGRRR